MPVLGWTHRFALIGLIFMAGCATLARAEPIGLPSGLAVDPPEDLDVTYQVVRGYDEKERVLAGWDGDKLQYFIAIEKLPPDYLDADIYLSRLARDLESAWGNLEIGRRETYSTKGGLKATVVAFSSKSDATDAKTRRLIVHFLTDGTGSYVADASVIASASVEQVFDYTIRQESRG